MEWRDEGMVVGVRRHGESSVLLELMTREHGRHLGLVRGGRSSRLQPVLPYALGVSAASLLYVAVADLIPGLHRRVGARDSVLQVILIGLGVALVALVERLHPH